VKSPVALSSFPLRAGRLMMFGFLIAAVPALGGCPGNLDDGINSIPEGSGGNSGSGGSQGTGGMTSSGGDTGSGGTTATGGTTGSGGTVASTGGATATGTGGMVTATGGKVGSGGMMAAGGRSGSGGSSAGGSMGSGGAGTVATCDAPPMVFKSSTVGCIDSGCHAKGAGNTPPDLQTADPTVLKAYKTTLLCMGGALVVPSNPTSSVLYKVVDGTSCGALMPQGKPNLTQAQEDCLAAWIANIK